MADRVLFYYITDRSQFPGSESDRRRALLAKIAEAAQAGVDYIQLREKDLATRDLEGLARDAVVAIRTGARSAGQQTSATRLLINSRTDVALAAGADGVHLRSDDVDPFEVRKIWEEANGCISQAASEPLIGVSCHSGADVLRAASNRADFAVFAPVFEKGGVPALRTAALGEACAAKIPVFALGGVTIGNAAACIAAGAAGIAGIRLFQENDISYLVSVVGAFMSQKRLCNSD